MLHSEYFDGYFSNANNFQDSRDEIKVDCNEQTFQLIIDYMYNYQSLRYYDENDYIAALKICDMSLFSKSLTNRIYKKYKYIKHIKSFPNSYNTKNNIGANEIQIDGSLDLGQIDLNDEWVLSAYSNANGKKLHDLEKRSSFTHYCSSIVFGHNLQENMYDFNITGVGEPYPNYAKLLKYIPGSKFEEHIDIAKDYYDGTSCGNHLFIKYSNDAEGGDLIVNNKPIITSDLGKDKWLYHFMKLNVMHKVSELKKGLRYCVIVPHIDPLYCPADCSKLCCIWDGD